MRDQSSVGQGQFSCHRVTHFGRTFCSRFTSLVAVFALLALPTPPRSSLPSLLIAARLLTHHGTSRHFSVTTNFPAVWHDELQQSFRKNDLLALDLSAPSCKNISCAGKWHKLPLASVVFHFESSRRKLCKWRERGLCGTTAAATRGKQFSVKGQRWLNGGGV